MAEITELGEAIRLIDELKKENERLRKKLIRAERGLWAAVVFMGFALLGACILLGIVGITVAFPGASISYNLVPSATALSTLVPTKILSVTPVLAPSLTTAPTTTTVPTSTALPTAGRPTQTALPSPTLDPRFKVRVSTNRPAWRDEGMTVRLIFDGVPYELTSAAFVTGKQVPMCEWAPEKRLQVLRCSETKVGADKSTFEIVYYISYVKGDEYTEGATPSK